MAEKEDLDFGPEYWERFDKYGSGANPPVPMPEESPFDFFEEPAALPEENRGGTVEFCPRCPLAPREKSAQVEVVQSGRGQTYTVAFPELPGKLIAPIVTVECTSDDGGYGSDELRQVEAVVVRRIAACEEPVRKPFLWLGRMVCGAFQDTSQKNPKIRLDTFNTMGDDEGIRDSDWGE